jgi:hypothetical protein
MRDATAPEQWRPGRHVVVERLGSVMVLINTQTNRIYELSPTGARAWELLSSGSRQDDLRARMLAEFDVDEIRLTDELDRLLESLASEGLIEADRD